MRILPGFTPTVDYFQQYKSTATTGITGPIPQSIVATPPRGPETTVKKTGDQGIQILDWKNHQVFLGDVYEIVFNVDPILQRLFTSVSALIVGLPFWMLPYWHNAKGWTTALVNKVLKISSERGIMENRIKVLKDETGFSSDFKTFTLTFEVIENSWPLFAVVAAVLAVTGYLTVREIRLIKKPSLSISEGISNLSWPLALLASVIVAAFIIPRFTD